MKRKLVWASLLLVIVVWMLTGVDPVRMLIEFVAAGALPGVHLTLNPYFMVILAIVGGAGAVYYIYTIGLPEAPRLTGTQKKHIQTITKPRRRFARLETE